MRLSSAKTGVSSALVAAWLAASALPALAQGDVSFLTCTPTAPGALTYDCEIASSCQGSPCGPELWTPIDGQASLPASFFEPGGTRGSAIQVTPTAIEGDVYTLVSKDVGAERWAIIRNDSTGVVTGNVFNGTGGDAQFIYCVNPTESEAGVAFGECFAAQACGVEGCDPADWESIGGTAPIAASFFNPSAGRGSGLQVTPDGEQILISKDLGTQRWTITTLAVTTSAAFPLGIGPSFGNVFEAGEPEATLQNVLIANGSRPSSRRPRLRPSRPRATPGSPHASRTARPRCTGSARVRSTRSARTARSARRATDPRAASMRGRSVRR
jgi:hypothetical protein